jgi:MoaA/NifB/PqqE/SkfB family radical SAM enzyme
MKLLMKYDLDKFPVIDLYITGKCNFRCPYCFGEDVSKGDIDIRVFERAVEFAKYCGSNIGFTGGEPLLHESFRGLVKIAKDNEVPIILRTNGMLLHEYLDIISSFEWIGISIDGASKNEVRKMRPTASGFEYDEVDKWINPLENIKFIKKNYPEVKILLASMVSGFNVSSLVELSRYLCKENILVDKWKLYQFTRNNFRSLTSSDKFETTEDLINDLKINLKKYYNGDLVSKIGEGNCLVVDTSGRIRINEDHLGSIFEDYSLLVEKITGFDSFRLIKHNKDITYNAT